MTDVVSPSPSHRASLNIRRARLQKAACATSRKHTSCELSAAKSPAGTCMKVLHYCAQHHPRPQSGPRCLPVGPGAMSLCCFPFRTNCYTLTLTPQVHAPSLPLHPAFHRPPATWLDATACRSISMERGCRYGMCGISDQSTLMPHIP